VARRLARWPLLLAVVGGLAAVAAMIAACERPAQPSVENYCREITAAEGLDESLANFDPDALVPQVAALRRASKVAPSDIAPQVNTVLSLTSTLQATIETARTDQAAAMEEALRQHADDLPAVTDAGRAVEAYTSANCGIALNSTAVPTSPN
jgi:hypothetical protein